MARLMHSYRVAFAKIGQPTCASGPFWPNGQGRTKPVGLNWARSVAITSVT